MSMRSQRVPEEYVRWTKLLYAKLTNVVRHAVGTSRPFPVEVGVHQGSSFSSLLFILFMDTIRVSSNLQKQVQSWKERLQQHGLRLSVSKSEYMECEPRIENGSIRVDGTELNKVECFKYLGSKVTSKAGRARVNAAWMRWKMATGVLCDKRVPVRIEFEDLQDGCLCVLLLFTDVSAGRRRKQLQTNHLETVLHAMEMRMLRWMIGVTLKDKVSNDTARSIFGVAPITNKMKEARLRWFGHVLRRQENSVATTALKLDVSGVGPRSRPRIRWLDRVKLDVLDARLCTVDALN
ncbi:hypothetical protein RB195_010652 [Necator americanus]|uniref:Reverse transcriptase domain-containing protein n=1 Tax=Necator americanus TaxID=51031 RepID=A0ABR1D0P4_NECAM